MVNPPLSGTGGIYLGNQILSPFDQPGPVTRSRSRSRNETLLTGTDDKTPHRLPFSSIDSNSCASSSSTTSSARSDTSGYNQGREGTPITPPSDYGEDVKGLEAPSYAADSRGVPTFLLPRRGLIWDSSGDSNRSREVPRPSTPQSTEEDEDPWYIGSTSAVTQGLGFVEKHDESPTVRRVRTFNLKKLADAAKAAKSAEAAEAAEEAGEIDEDERIAGISEALGALCLDSENNNTESTEEPEGIDEAVQEPKETEEAVVSGASHGPQPEQQQQTSFVAVDSSSSSGEDRVSSFPNSETAVLPREVDEQLDIAITLTTRSLMPTLIPNNTIELALDDGLDAIASLDVN
ncbi:hypothetical protein VE01_00848 [Pseudogymnoascus verrucosus]|uniref:Uncharacterized protein n=1 Tax=Pseudogymnoascus verrucosus TaxID=342668 RepID=A0A2P2SVP9_9PEZI|nr:uncharacterized protein VE01_00848 [Pseudogymnoascus verrucosus]OBU00906.1 hypothetical protein VE01_00848 [Pseudogymnoascus verrucosus]